FQLVVLAALLAVANAGYLGGYAAAPALAYGGYAAAPAYGGYAAHGYGYGGYATPAITSQQSNILRTPGNLGQVSTYSKTINTPYSSVSKSDVRVSNDALAYGAVAAPAYGYAAHGIAAAPALAYGARAYGYGAPALAYGAAPALAARAYAAPAIAAHGLLGTAYSAAPAVAHVSYAGLGAHYAW
ncbi:cuticle protein 76-like, partial [Anabrus simplex]|uniref:cuticle protein 76-like n=1 Tax=Anabrus simplex TaxID=316456 RepID=UPI0035A269CE